MDAFFASVEQRNNPELRGKPIVVGFDGAHGVVSTASYEARRFGIHSAMPIAQAKKRCRDLIIVPSHLETYKDVSQKINRIFHEHTDIVEPLSLDEAFLDVTVNKKGITLATDIAREIKENILRETGLTASAGISYNKFLAKIASDWRKPDGLYTIHPDHAIRFIADLPIEKFWGIGRKTACKMHTMGIFKGEHLLNVSREHLTNIFGKAGNIYYDFARGIDERQVEAEHERKSVGCEHTFQEDLITRSAIIIELYHIVLELTERIRKSDFQGKTLTLKIKFSDISQISRSVTGTQTLRTKEEILPLAKQLLKKTDISQSIRLMGLTVSQPHPDEERSKNIWTEGVIKFPKA